MKNIEQAYCQRIDLHSNQCPKIIKSLSFPCFTNIVTLVLQKNRIDNVEALTFLNMETINFLDLDDNSITSLKTFNKLNWPSLRKLQIRNNFIQQFEFTRMKTKNHIQKIYLDQMFDQRVMTQDISMLLKLQTLGIDNLQIESKHRIRQQSILKQMSQKYQTIEISDWALFESEQDQFQDQDQDQDSNQDQSGSYIVFQPVSPV